VTRRRDSGDAGGVDADDAVVIYVFGGIDDADDWRGRRCGEGPEGKRVRGIGTWTKEGEEEGR
jgi:hypothetical protein